MDEPEQLLTQAQVATWLAVSPRTIRDWRTSNRGPRAVRVGGSLRYRRADVQAYIDSNIEQTAGVAPE